MISNEPTEFKLNLDNYLTILLEWMPDCLHKMRQYQAKSIVLESNAFSSLQCTYMNTIGGEKFRIFDKTPYGDSGAHYYPALGCDEDIILQFASRVEKELLAIKNRNMILKNNNECEATLKFISNYP